MDSLVYTVNEYIELKKLHALAIRARENELPIIENRLVKKITKNVKKHVN